MTKSIILLIIIIGFSSIQSTNSFKYNNKYHNYYNSLVKKCNNYALNKTNLRDVYNCLTTTKVECKNIEHYETFIKSRDVCFSNINNKKASIDIIVYLVIWIVFVIFI